MYEVLETYVEEIRRHLAVKHGAEEILAEIKSHILEKAENESGSVTEESLRRAIAAYGSPRGVAEKYLEGVEIISPAFRKHLVRYTWVLFAIHAVLTVVAVFTRSSIVAFPFFFIPKMSVLSGLIYLPMALVYDFGIVALLLYVVTQRHKDVRLPWPGLFRPSPARAVLGRPRIGALVMHLAFFGAVLFVLIKYGTVMFYTVNFAKPVSLLPQVPALFYSTLIVAALGCHVIAYAVRFLFNSAWVYVARDLVILILLWTAWNAPIDPQFVDVPGLDLGAAAGGFIFLLGVLVAVRLVRNIQRVRREMMLP